MAVRLYAAFAVLATLAVLLYAADRVGLVHLPGMPAPDAGSGQSAVRTGKVDAARMAPLDEALAAYRAQRYDDALQACGKAIAAAESAGRARHALALLTCGGFMGMHRHAPQRTEQWLKKSVAIAAKLEQDAIVAALGPGEAFLKQRGLRMLGVFYRDRNRPREAAEQFALAVEAVRAMPPPETGDHRMALRSDLFDLGVALAQLGYRRTARRAFEESRSYYLKTEPKHSALKTIEAQERRLGEPAKRAP